MKLHKFSFMEEWKEYKLGDLISLNSGGTPDKNNKSYWEGNIPWISAKYMYDDYLYSSELKISQEGLTCGSRLAPKGSILLLTRGSGLFNRIPVCYTMRDLAYNQDVKCIESSDTELVSTEFLFYWLMGNKDSISAILETTGIGAGKIDTNRLKNIRILLPSKEYQQALIDFAKSLMHKIEVNRRINDNLEQQAQALFKSWFVDFEPFKNGEFVESELGMIPKGWRVGKLGELCQFKRGKGLLSKNAIPGDVPVVAGGLEPACYHNVSNTKAPVITVSGSGANAGFMRMYHQEVWASDCSFIDISCVNWLFVYCFLAINSHLLRHAQTGAVQPHVKPADIHDFDLVIPPKENIQRFQDKISSFITKKGLIEQESRRLASLRDTLLPKLMSGELKVNEVY